MDKKSNGALGKALAILEAIAEDGRPIAVPDIVDATGLPARRCTGFLNNLKN